VRSFREFTLRRCDRSLTRGHEDSRPGPMGTKQTSLMTIGYESADVADFIATLRAAGVRRIIDVRELAISRRKGFAKRALSAALQNAGINYVHLRGLGDPKEGREAARAGDVERFRRVFVSHMSSDAAKADLQKASDLVTEGGACLMCFERDHSACHRSIVAQAICGSIHASVRHLGVRAGLASRRNKIDANDFAEERP
jgi:uncharacterized protein (DUF488 family)